jgi:hypothetical protein
VPNRPIPVVILQKAILAVPHAQEKGCRRKGVRLPIAIGRASGVRKKTSVFGLPTSLSLRSLSVGGRLYSSVFISETDFFNPSDIQVIKLPELSE